jgi:hypothetical protein
MGVSLPISVLVVAFLAGCTSTVQVGLANAPLLINGGTPETRVHDVIANGHDACERNGFPPGEVLKGHIPPCIKKEKFAAVPDFRWNPPPAPPRHVRVNEDTWISPRYPLGVCPSPGPGLSRSETGVAAASLSASSAELACNEPW